MDGLGAELMQRWRHLAHELGWEPESADAVGGDLIARYSEPHRHYHGVRHLRAVLMVLDELAEPAVPPAAERLAAWFHDAVYMGVPGDDEERSAQLAEHDLRSLGLDPVEVTRVASMVRATASHFDPDATHDARTALLLDADLAILGASPDAYDAYAAGVRAEHPGVTPELFRRGRRAVIDRLLARPWLFLTTTGRDRFEAAARANLTRERDSLDGSG